MTMRKDKELQAWENEKKYIPIMIKKYCHHYHHTKKDELCPECQKLTEYALFRLSVCPFKKNKKFCSVCKIHCYQSPYKEQIRNVMQYSGQRMIFTHPIFAFKHAFQILAYKRKLKKKHHDR